VACHFCDSLHHVTLIEEGKDAHCKTCGHVLYRNRPQSLERAIAFGLMGVICLAGMLFLPFISLESHGNTASTTGLETVFRLWETGGSIISMAVLLFIMLLPLIQLFGLLYLCIPLLGGLAVPWMPKVARLLQSLQAWVMVEVFFLGTLVSLLKLVKLADIELGLGFWSMIGLMLSLAAAVGGIDRLELWDRIEVARKRRTSQQEGTVPC